MAMGMDEAELLLPLTTFYEYYCTRFDELTTPMATASFEYHYNDSATLSTPLASDASTVKAACKFDEFKDCLDFNLQRFGEERTS